MADLELNKHADGGYSFYVVYPVDDHFTDALFVVGPQYIKCYGLLDRASFRDFAVIYSCQSGRQGCIRGNVFERDGEVICGAAASEVDMITEILNRSIELNGIPAIHREMRFM